ncbi:unconventional prefoldin RPB5 interactor 1 isoform X2 [Rhinatrema bivittatum]|nr:unconventional prefoldin RPB5 interactor 1 isoform X2 [Rhinatrema bivittatum]XP_029464305.1 unconventional prefoldin RPB5 interactor 1 isoform X2 [Rhinatrema bivittatum]
MVPFGPLAFMPGRLVHTNEITVLLGDNWFAKCSAKQANSLVDHRKKHVRKTLDDLQVVMKNFESRVEFTEDLQKMTDEAGDLFDIREETENEDVSAKGRHRIAHKPHSKPKVADVFEAELHNAAGDVKAKELEDLWARLDELENQEQLLGECDRLSEAVDANREEIISPEEEKEDRNADLDVAYRAANSLTQGDVQNEGGKSELFSGQVNGTDPYHSDDEDDAAAREDSVPTIYFSHTVEPKRVRINTGKNTTLKFSEKKEEAKRKKKNSNGNGHLMPELPNIKTPADIYRVFVDVVNGEYVPRKSILKSRSRENSVCSDTSESSAADFDDRRGILRSLSCEEASHSDTSEGILEEEEHVPKKHLPFPGKFEAFSGTVVEKETFCPSAPHLSFGRPVLPTIPERKSEEVFSEVLEETTKRISKFKAARLQQRK